MHYLYTLLAIQHTNLTMSIILYSIEWEAGGGGGGLDPRAYVILVGLCIDLLVCTSNIAMRWMYIINFGNILSCRQYEYITDE